MRSAILAIFFSAIFALAPEAYARNTEHFFPAQEAADRPDLMREVASAYQQVGDIRGGLRGGYGNKGDTEGALENYRTAAALRETMMEALPDDEQLLLDASRGFELGIHNSG